MSWARRSPGRRTAGSTSTPAPRSASPRPRPSRRSLRRCSSSASTSVVSAACPGTRGSAWRTSSSVRAIRSGKPDVRALAACYADATNALYLGRGVNFPVALEGALKLKEISYIHAEGYPAAEMKHGPIALIDENMPVVFIAPHDSVFDKVTSNVQEMKARGGRVIALTSRAEPSLAGKLDFEFRIPETIDMLYPILAVVPLQLLAYYMAVLRGCDVDRPRNLAKSVTVE